MDSNTWERRLEDHARRGETLDLRSEVRDHEQPMVRGEVLTELALRLSQEGIAPRGIQLKGATINGVLDLEFVDFGRPLELEECTFENTPILEQSRLLWLSLRDSVVPGIRAYQLRVDFDVYLNGRFDTTGDLELAGAVIGGRFVVGDPEAFARQAPWTLDLMGARVGADIDVLVEHGRRTGAPDIKRSVVLDNADIGGNLRIAGQYASISMIGTSIHDNLVATGLHVQSGSNPGPAVNAERIRIDGDLLLLPALREDGGVLRQTLIDGGISLVGGGVGGATIMRAVWLTAPSGGSVALDANALEAHGNIEITGTIAQDPDTPVGEATMKSTIRGAVDLSNITTAGHVILTGSDITSNTNWAVDLTSARIDRDLMLGTGTSTADEPLPANDSLIARGGVSLISAQIGGALYLRGTTLEAQDPEAELGHDDSYGLTANLMRVAKGITWEPESSIGMIDFSYVETQLFQDDPERWPPQDCLNLEGFAYQKLLATNNDLTSRSRLTWLRRQVLFNPDSYDTLRDFYLRAGDRGAAADVAIAKYQAQAAERGRGWSVVARVYDRIAGCGYKPIRSIIWLVGLWFATGVALYVLAHTTGIIVPADLAIGLTAAGDCTASYPCFSGFRYSFETIIPLVGGKQLDDWRVDTSNGTGTALQLYLGMASLAGLLFSTTAIGALTGLLRRD